MGHAMDSKFSWEQMPAEEELIARRAQKKPSGAPGLSPTNALLLLIVMEQLAKSDGAGGGDVKRERLLDVLRRAMNAEHDGERLAAEIAELYGLEEVAYRGGAARHLV